MLVVGHSDTVGNIVNALGVSETLSPINNEYDNLFVIVPATATMTRIRY